MMAWHSFVSSKHERKRRSENLEENLKKIKGEEDEE